MFGARLVYFKIIFWLVTSFFMTRVSSYYDTYDDDVIYNDQLERLRRAADDCEEQLEEPIEKDVDNIYPTSARINWREVDKAQWYDIKVKSPETSCVRGEDPQLNETSLILRDLDADTAYVISVTAHNVNGCSIAKEITFSTGPGTWKCAESSDVPTGVTELQIPKWNITSSQALATWSPVPKALMYKVELSPSDPNQLGVGLVAGEKTLLKGLEPGYQYTLIITTLNGIHRGPSFQDTFITRLNTPDTFEVVNASSTYFKLLWERPQYATYYILRFYKYAASGEHYEDLSKKRNISTEFVYFQNLQPAKRYRVTLQAFNQRASSPFKSLENFYTKLPMTSNVVISNVTSFTAFASWEPVEGADKYRLRLLNHDTTVAKDIIVTGTEYLLDKVESASHYFLHVIAKNEHTDSLPKVVDIYTRLEQVKILDVDKAYVEDTSLVIRWGAIGGASWYKIVVTPDNPRINGAKPNDDNKYTRLENLTPGTLYTITIIAENSKIYDTSSLPTTVEQFTRLSQPLNLAAAYDDITNVSMKVTWSPVPGASTYLLLVYDCSGADRTVGVVAERSADSAPTVLPPKFKKVAKDWVYNYPKLEQLKLQCEDAFQDIQHALEEGEKQHPSRVVGQGRVKTNEVVLSNMRPGTRYEIVVVSGSKDIQSNPSVLLKYTKLDLPHNFGYDPRSVLSTSVFLKWDQVQGAAQYQLYISYTPSTGPPRRGRKSIHVRSTNISETQWRVRSLKSTTNYSFTLTARNEHTQSFPVHTTAFTRLPLPATPYYIPESLTTDAMLIQWTPVDDAQYYNVSFIATNSRTKRQIPQFQTVTDPQIFLKDLIPNTFYQISIVASNRYTRSLASKMDTFTKLPTPANFTIANVTDSTILLTWSDVEGREVFEIAAVKSEDKTEVIFRNQVTEARKLFDTLEANQAYRILMRAANQNTMSDTLEKFTYTKLPRPQQCRFVFITDKKIRLRWRPVVDAEVYSLVIIPLFNESRPNTSMITPEMRNDIIQVDDVGLTRSRRDVSKGKIRTKRVRREDFVDDSDAESDDLNFVQYRSVVKRGKSAKYDTVEEGKEFANPQGIYYVNVTSSEVILNNLQPGVKYRFTLRANNENTDSLPVTKQTFTELEKPKSLEIPTVLNSSIVIRWLAVWKATYYQVYIKAENKPMLFQARSKTTNTTSTEVTAKGLSPNVNYTVIVQAGNNHIKSEKTVTWKITKLSPVENLYVIPSSVKHDRFHIKWREVAYASNYVITINPPTRRGRSRITIPQDTTEATINQLRDGTKYQVTVMATNERTTGIEKTIILFTKLLTPKNLDIIKESVTSSNFTVRWLPVPKADEYKITLRNSSDNEAKNISVNKPTAFIDGLASGQEYWVTVIAFNIKQDTVSDPVTVNSFTKLEKPENFQISEDEVTDRSIIVTWDRVPLATEYVVTVGVEHREGDHYSVFLRLEKREHRVATNFVEIDNLHPASHYLIQMQAVNKDTESFNVSIYQFTRFNSCIMLANDVLDRIRRRPAACIASNTECVVFIELPRPGNISQEEHMYMDTEAILEWQPVKEAEFYILEIFEIPQDLVLNQNNDSSYQSVEYDVYNQNYDYVNQSDTLLNSNMSLILKERVDGEPYHRVVGLIPETHYFTAVQAHNKDTKSDSVTMIFVTKSPCSEDYHHFPNTHLSQTLPRLSINNSTRKHCLQTCCSLRDFECRSVSLHRSTSACLIFAEDRNLAPPLSISRMYDHYERKFWMEVSGFQIRSLTHNNAAVMNETVELTLTFVYLGKSGCVQWDFGDNTFAYHSILDTNCSFLCDEADEDINCTIIDTDPNNDNNQIKIKHDYDMKTVFTAIVNVTDGKSFQTSECKVAINDRGCIYPSIIIEDEGKNILDPKRIYRSSKLLISATPEIVCKIFPGIGFKWRAISYADDLQTQTDSFSLVSKGSEILIPALTFPLGMYKVSVSISLKKELSNLKATDSIYVMVEPSPLVANVKGGSMRTVGAKKVVTWDSSSVSFDPDIVGEDRRKLQYMWFCRNYTDHRFLPFESGSCFPDIHEITFNNPGMFSLNTSLMHLYVEYEFRVIVTKGERSSEFKQQIIVKEGDPPDFHIKCVENCKKKMNPTQALALQAVCGNCKPRRDPVYKWRLYQVVVADTVTVTTASPVTQASAEISPASAAEEKTTALEEIFGWEDMTTTGSDTLIVVLNKHALIGGREYIMRINISMEGLDDRVYSYSDFRFRTNLPPYGGVCTTASTIGNCDSFVTYPALHLSSVTYKKEIENTTMEICKEYCCLTREFMCLSFSFNARSSLCWLFDQNKQSTNSELEYEPEVDHYERLFYRGGAVIDEVVFECRDWKDEGERMSYPKPGERPPKTTLSYKFTTLPSGNKTKGLLLYFGSVPKTPGISMALGNPSQNFSVFVIAQVCDMYGECALSNLVSLQIVPPDSAHIGETLTGFTNGNASKLAILSNTGNSKAAAQLVQSISSLINVDDEDDEVVFGNHTYNYTTTVPYATTTIPTTTDIFTTFAPTSNYDNATHNSTGGIAKDAKKNLRSDIVSALSVATSAMTSIDNLQQMTSAMNAITQKTDEIDPTAQTKASDTVLQMASSLSSFSDDTNKEDVAAAANNIIGSLGSVAKASETDMNELQSQLSERSEIDYARLDEEDLSPDEFEYYKKKKLRSEKKRVRRSALGSQNVVENAMGAMDSTAGALLGKQMEGEPPVDVSSDKLEMKVEKTSPDQLKNFSLSTGKGTSLKLPSAEALLGKNATNTTEPIDMQVMAFDDNPFGFGEDAAFINSPVTMLKIGASNGATLGSNDTDDPSAGVGISVPSKFSPDDMITVERNINDTSLSISKFEVLSSNNAILIIIEPDDDRAEFEVVIRQGEKPNEEEFDYRFALPKKLWEVDDPEDLYKIFISEDDVEATGVFYIGIKDLLNISHSIEATRGRVRRRRSVVNINSTTYHLLIATPGCRRFDQEKKEWTGDGCKVDQRSTPEVTECFCTKLSPTSVFSAEFFVPPNTINFATVFAKINIADNPAVFSTVITFMGVYLLMLIWARRTDKKDIKKWSLKTTTDNRKEDKHLYQVSVFTGHGRNAATHSKVSCVIFGENGKSRVRKLAIKEDQTPFTRSSVVHFLIREPKSLGPLSHLHVWHDNTGKGENRSWYLDQVVLQNIKTGRRYFFICDQWLAVEHDDGKVDRILPVATPENMSTFHRLFVSTTTQKFTEDHLWISLFYRPTKSNFTRCQRLSCCMALLFMTMIANALFFESGTNSAKSGTRTMRIGPFTLSPLQLWTSFCSTLLVVPVTTLVMTLFKKAKTKEQERIDKEEKETIERAVEKFNARKKIHNIAATLPEPSDLVGYDAVYKINQDGTINAKPNIATRGSDSLIATPQWPHYCVYIAWTLTSLAVIVSGFFAILYSFEWGKDKAERWLCNMMLSFWQSVFIVQPLKVIALAMFVAIIVKKPDQQALDTIDAREVKQAEKSFINLCAENIEAEIQEKEAEYLTSPKPPSKRKLRKARRLRRKEKAMSEIIWEVIAYFFYIMILLFLCHGTRDSKGLRITHQIKTTFVESTYGLKSVSTVDQFWRFVNQLLLPNLYPDHWYNGDKKSWRNRNFLTDEQSYRVGPARLRQIRVNEHPCPIVGATQRDCRGHFKLFDEEKGDYIPGWKSRGNMTEYTEDDLIDNPTLIAWQHKSWVKLNGVPFVGDLAVYPGGGYCAELGVNYESGKMVAESLFEHSWIDHQTRAVFAEFTLYNPNVNLFTGVQLLTEFPAMGSAVTFTSVMTFRLYQYIGAYGTVMVLAQIIFVIHLLSASISTVRSLIKLKKKFFHDPWNIFETIVLTMDWLVFSFYVFRLVLTSFTLNAFHKNKRKYVNFQQVMGIDVVVSTMLAVSAFLGIIRFLKLLRFNRNIGMLTSVLKNSARQWPGFFVLAAVFFIAFIHIGYLVFSPFLEDFKNILTSMETMFSLMMGRPLYDQLRTLYRVFGPVFYFFFCFTAAFIVINVLIAIINESYGVTLEVTKKKKNDYEIVDFMIKRFAKWTGLKFLQPPAKKAKQPPLSPSKVPLPTLPYALDAPRRENLVDFQKTMDKYMYDLENKYSKHLTLEEFRDEVMAEMGNVAERNHGIQKGVLRDRRLSRKSDQSRSLSLGLSSQTKYTESISTNQNSIKAKASCSSV